MKRFSAVVSLLIAFALIVAPFPCYAKSPSATSASGHGSPAPEQAPVSPRDQHGDIPSGIAGAAEHPPPQTSTQPPALGLNLAQRIAMLAQLTLDYTSYVYTHSDILLFAYEDSTYFQVYYASGTLLWSGTLNNRQHRSLTPGAGVYYAAASKPFSINVGDAITDSVWGYYAMDQHGKGLSTQLYTYQADWTGTSYDPHFIVFAYENGTQVQVRDTSTGQLIWSGTLNDGEHYSNTTLDDAFITVTSSKPVSALSYTDQGYYVPASNTTFVGRKFHTFLGNAAWPDSHWPEDLNLIAYENASVTVRNTTSGALIWSGLLNAGQVHSIPDLNGNYVTIQSSGNIAVSVSPFVSYPDEPYYYSVYAPDSSGTGIGSQFTIPTIPAITDVACRLIMFSYDDGADVTVRDSSGATIWSGVLDQADSHTELTEFTVYSIASSGEVSALIDCGDQAGASFAPVHYAVVQVRVISPVGGNYYYGSSMRISAEVKLRNVPLLGALVVARIGLTAGGDNIKVETNDSGINGDEVAGDGTYSANVVLPGPSDAPAGNYYVFVSAQKEEGGETSSGSGSTMFTLVGLPGGSLAPDASLGCPHSPDVFAGDRCLLSVSVVYPDHSVHADGSVVLTVHEPGNRQVAVSLANTGANVWQANYAFAEAGRYLLDIQANPPPASPYVSGYDSLVEDVLASASPLSVTVIGLPATFLLHQMATFTTTASANGQPVSDAAVVAQVSPGGTNVDLLSAGGGVYVGLYPADTAGSFTVDFVATHPLYKSGAASASFNVSAAGAGLLGSVQSMPSSTGILLRLMSDRVLQVAQDGDWFWQKIGPDLFMRDFDFLVNFVSFGLDLVQLGGELQKAAAKSMAPVTARFGGVNLFSWLRDQADVSIDGRIFRSWATRLETAVQSGLFDTYLVTGRLPRNVGQAVLLRASVYYASKLLAATMDVAAQQAVGSYLANLRLSNDSFLEQDLYPIFAASVTEDNRNLKDYADAILVDPPSVSQDLGARLLADLSRRRQANSYLVDDVLQRTATIWIARATREFEDNLPWYLVWGEVLWKAATPILIGLVCGGPWGAGVGVVISAASLIEDWVRDSHHLEVDEQMHALAYGSMFTSLETKEALVANALAGLAQVRSGRTPEVPDGRIVSIDDISRGDQFLLFFSERQAVSSITIRNTGLYPADYNIRAYYDRLSNGETQFDVFWLDSMVDPSTGEVIGWVRLAPGQTKTIEVVFKNKDQNNLDMRPNDGDGIRFVLAANTPNGLYFMGTETHDFYPRQVTMAGEALTAEAQLPTLPHPLGAQVGRNPGGTEYTIELFVDNPLPHPISVRLEQGIPASLTILSPGGGVVENDKIQWRQIVQPHESAEFAYNVRNDRADDSSIQVPAAELSFYAAAISEVHFTGAPLTIEAPTVEMVYLPVVRRNYGEAGYRWLDATSGSVVAQGDDTIQYVNLPFAFTFYGNTYTGLYVSSNGYVSFGSGYSNFSNTCIPSTGVPNNAIYGLWDDLVPTGGTYGNVYVKRVDSGTFVIEWYNVALYGGAGHETFEIVLRNDRSITLQYQSVSSTASATVGVENGAGTLAKQRFCNGLGDPVSNLLSIRYTTP
jgi:hypothetical protein